jgi:hypothetical protein
MLSMRSERVHFKDSRTQWDAREIDDSVLGYESHAIGEWRGYDLVAAR